MSERVEPADWIQHHDRVLATFAPLNRATLKPEATEWVGWRGYWTAGWIIEDGRPYAGQFAMSPLPTIVPDGYHRLHGPMLWVPLCDLADVELAPYTAARLTG